MHDVQVFTKKGQVRFRMNLAMIYIDFLIF